MDARPIGVFDSGVGGISVLKGLVKLMPGERFVYYGDTKNAPYGVRDEQDIQRLTQAAVDELMKRDIKALVIACNTATSAAAEALRQSLPIPVVGMEPALKPAATQHGRGRIVVMATPATLRQSKFQRLYEAYGQYARMAPCEGLMEFVERGELDSDALDAYLREKLLDGGEPASAVVLGCTHYVFLKRAIRKLFPDAELYDGNLGTAKRLLALLELRDELNGSGEGGVELLTSGDEAAVLPIMRMLFALNID